jgi:Nucleotidyltransferase of unknown function (DUF6036)
MRARPIRRKLARHPPGRFHRPEYFFPLWTRTESFDILVSIPGVDFDAAWERRIETVIDTATGLKANFISADDLIATKLASGRPRDLADVDDVRKQQRASAPAHKKSDQN